MQPDLERLIRLQDLDSTAQDATSRIKAVPERQAALEARLTAKQQQLDAAKAALADSHRRRREIEKDLATVQSRLNHYKDQLMSVKTNREYQAMQHEIATAEREVQRFEDAILELMLADDELERKIAVADRELNEEEAAIAAERLELDSEREGLERELERAADERRRLVSEIGRDALSLFEHVARGRGIVMSQAKDGLCSVCHVRLRPQIYNEVLKNDSLIQCESCQRLLYFVPAAVTG